MLTLRRFQALSDSYGADLSRWPIEVRGEAEALLAASPDARELHKEARSLDEVIKAASAGRNAELTSEAQSAALARLKSAVAARLATTAPHQKAVGPFGRLLDRARWGIALDFGRAGLVTGAVLVVVGGLLIGSLYAPSPQTSTMLTLLQPAPMQIFSE